MDSFFPFFSKKKYVSLQWTRVADSVRSLYVCPTHHNAITKFADRLTLFQLDHDEDEDRLCALHVARWSIRLWYVS